MINEVKFAKQLKAFKNGEKDVQVKYNILKSIELYNKENIYNINMVINSEEEAINFVNRVENPDQEWKTLPDVIIDVRREKLGQTDITNTEYIEKIEQLLNNKDYIGLHQELEGLFLHRIGFSDTRKFLKKVEMFSLIKVMEIIKENICRGFSTTMCMIQ